jgi:hypothetical protein
MEIASDFPAEAWVDTQYQQWFGSGIMANWIQNFKGID